MNVAFVSLASYPLLDPSEPGIHGGAEVRAINFAKALAGRAGFAVTVVVRGEGANNSRRVGNITVRFDPDHAAVLKPESAMAARFKHDVERRASFPWLKVRRWRAGLIWEAPAALARHWRFRRHRRRLLWPRGKPKYRGLDARVLCGFGVNEVAADVVASCRGRGKKSVVFIASDHDLSDRYFKGSDFRGVFGEPGDLCHWTLVNADYVVVQTSEQLRLLRERFGREGRLIRNPIDLTPAALPGPEGEGRYMLWVGRADRVQKRPLVCLDLARRCPEVRFVMVMNRCDDALFEQAVAECPGNVRIVERVPFDRIEGYFRGAAGLISTSCFEGFPNTFLQAGKYGRPIVSLEVDPEGMLGEHGCGLAAGGDVERMAEEVRRVWSDEGLAGRLGENARRYVNERHALAGRVDELARLLSEAAG